MIRAALIFDVVLFVVWVCLPVTSPPQHPPLPAHSAAYDDDILVPGHPIPYPAVGSRTPPVGGP